MTPELENSAGNAIRDYVLTKAALGIYNPNQVRRPRVPVVSFEIELLEIDEEDRIIHAAGPIILRNGEGDVERHLRISVKADFDGEECRISEGAEVRAAYIEETIHPEGACKETAALANAPILDQAPALSET